MRPRYHVLFVVLVSVLTPLGSAGSAAAQTWVETPSLLTARYTAYAPRFEFNTDPIAIRSGQQQLWFSTARTNFVRMDVCLGSESVCPEGEDPDWQVLSDGGYPRQDIRWTGVPTVPGYYEVQLRYFILNGPIEYRTFDLYVVPPAQRAFSHGTGSPKSTMMLWTGTTTALDSPLLVVEGIDADNVSNESHYYALGSIPESNLFGVGRSRGADVLILNFVDGGRDMRLNADVVRSAVLYVNQIKTGSRKLDVAGVSMGGVIARYALADMERDGVAHNVARFVSIDAPQQGAILDNGLLYWMRYPPSYADGNFEVPDNITSTAGKQLLVFNPFDTAFPSLHRQFFDELDAIGGDGYPDQTVENVGVSFGTTAANPNVDEEWLEIVIGNVVGNDHFYIEEWNDEALPGSFLPREITMIGGLANVFEIIDVDFSLDRKSHPTFIPYDSALDIRNGQSRFDGELIHADVALGPKFHDEVPPEIVEPLLSRLGYGVAPLAASFSGPSAVVQGDYDTWTSTTTGGQPPYTYLWEYAYPCDDPDPCPPGQDCALMMGPICDVWTAVGTGPSLTHTFAATYGSVKIRLTATDAEDTSHAYTRIITVTGGAGVAGAGGTASAQAGAPVAFALEGAHPNPFGAATTIRFGLPEAAEIRLAVYDALGREVAVLVDGSLEAGYHEAAFDGSALPSGTYLVRLVAASSHRVATERVTLLR